MARGDFVYLHPVYRSAELLFQTCVIPVCQFLHVAGSKFQARYQRYPLDLPLNGPVTKYCFVSEASRASSSQPSISSTCQSLTNRERMCLTYYSDLINLQPHYARDEMKNFASICPFLLMLTKPRILRFWLAVAKS